MLGFLAGTGDFGSLAVQAVVADAAKTIEARLEQSPNLVPACQPDLTGREALKYMNDVLGDLAAFSDQ